MIQPQTKKKNPLLAIAGALLGLCVLCVAGTSIANKMGLLPTGTPSTVPTFTLTATSSPTFTPVATETLVQTTALDYPRVASVRFQNVQEAMIEFIPLHEQFTANISLAADTDWWGHTSATLLRIEAGVHELASMQNFPPEFSAFNQIMIQLDAETQLLTPDYTLALETEDVDALNRATPHLSNMIVYMNDATNALTLAATPTETATIVPIPTATVIFIPPTAAQSDCLAAYPGVCIHSNPRLTCDELPKNFTVLPPDPLGYDRDSDGVGCEN